MRKHIRILSISLLFQASLFSQMTIDLGGNKHVCYSEWGIDTIFLGGNPTVSGGVPPYTYSWVVDPIELAAGTGIYLYGTDILDDTASANPRLLEIYPPNELNNRYFKLIVTDSLGNTAKDSVKITASIFYHTLLYYGWVINPGDSLFLNLGANVGGGVGSLTYLWQPSHGLSDTTLFTGFWAKPDSQIAYYVIVTDSMGCEMTGAPYYYFKVNAVGLSEEVNQEFQIFPNPAHKTVTIQLNAIRSGKTEVIFTDRMGQVVKSVSVTEESSFEIPLSDLPDGLYVVTITNSMTSATRKLLIQH